jgi:hypothetical protein
MTVAWPSRPCVPIGFRCSCVSESFLCLRGQLPLDRHFLRHLGGFGIRCFFFDRPEHGAEFPPEFLGDRFDKGRGQGSVGAAGMERFPELRSVAALLGEISGRLYLSSTAWPFSSLRSQSVHRENWPPRAAASPMLRSDRLSEAGPLDRSVCDHARSGVRRRRWLRLRSVDLWSQ